MTTFNARLYWANYERCLNRVAAEARTVDALIAILTDHYPPSCGEAFFPDGAERDLRSTLVECGWRVRWSRASYWFAICEPEGDAGITYTEGDIDRGVGVPGQDWVTALAGAHQDAVDGPQVTTHHKGRR